MVFDANTVPPQHGNASFWLELADRIIKFLALLVGAAWTWMHYRRSRTYAQKLELEVEGRIASRHGPYLEVVTVLKNLGASPHSLQARGTSCTAWAVMEDLSEIFVFSQNVFETDEDRTGRIHPGLTRL